MRDPRFLHVGFTAALPFDQGAADQVIASESFDWMRYASNCYIVWSSSDCETICVKILRVPGLQSANVLVCSFDVSDGFGSLPDWAWAWIKRDRGYGGVKLWAPPDHPKPLALPPAIRPIQPPPTGPR